MALSNWCRQVLPSGMPGSECQPTASTVATIGSFDVLGSGSVSADILLQPLPGSGKASASVALWSTDRMQQWASVSVNLDRATETYSFCSANAINCSSIENPFISNSRFHTYRFTVTDGTGRWERDGLTQLSGRINLAGPFQIWLSEIGVDVTAAKREYPVAYFDNVQVTRQ
jgi:hypothetical protein